MDCGDTPRWQIATSLYYVCSTEHYQKKSSSAYMNNLENYALPDKDQDISETRFL